MSLFNVLPPCLDLLVPPPAEAPQLAPIYRLGVLCVNQETMRGSGFQTNVTTGWRGRRHVLFSGSTWESGNVSSCF